MPASSGRVRALIGSAIVATGLLGGCAGDDGVRPVIAMGGQTLAMEDPVERGRAFLMMGQYGLAIEALSAKAEPADARGLTLLAVAYDRIHRTDLADRYYGRALGIDPHYVAALNNWGYSQLLRRNYAKAGELLHRAKEQRAEDPVIEANLRLLPGYAETKPQQAAAPEPPARAVTAGHVVAVKRRNVIVRTAPGVQTLYTRAIAGSV